MPLCSLREVASFPLDRWKLLSSAWDINNSSRLFRQWGFLLFLTCRRLLCLWRFLNFRFRLERFPTKVLLEENGIALSEETDLSTFPAIGEAKAVANLIVLRREKETQNQGAKVLDQVSVSPDGKQLYFRLKTHLLMEQYGVSELFRITLAKATLDSGDGNIMAVFASALEQDFNNGVDGPALEATVNSFQALSQPSS